MTKEKAMRTKFSFGKYRGKEIGVVWAEDEKYLQWCLENIEYEKFPDEMHAIAFLLDL